MAEFRIYKPRKDKEGKFVGAASKLQLVEKENKEKNYKYWDMFWTVTLQTGEVDGNASFDWVSDKNPNGKQIIMKLGLPDIGELLCVLNGVKNKVGQPGGRGLYHQTNEKNNSVLSFERKESNDQSKYDGGYMLTISAQKDGNTTRFSHSVSLSEGEALRLLLTEGMKRMVGV